MIFAGLFGMQIAASEAINGVASNITSLEMQTRAIDYQAAAQRQYAEFLNAQQAAWTTSDDGVTIDGTYEDVTDVRALTQDRTPSGGDQP